MYFTCHLAPHIARFLIVAWLLFPATSAPALTVRLKDVARISGTDGVQLVGFGLVTGLAGDGDKNPVYTVQAFANMLQRFGMSIPATAVQAKNIAAVMVTAEVPAFARVGSRIDVNVSSMGDAKSLTGGVLLQTPLLAGNGKLFAVAQGPVVLGGFSVGGSAAGVQKNHPTTGIIADGGKLVDEIEQRVVQQDTLDLVLKDPDFTSASRVSEAVNAIFKNACQTIDSTTIRVTIPTEHQGRPIEFIAQLEALEVSPDVTARIVVNERTGTIVANSLIRIGPCAISHGSLVISVAENANVSQPNAFSPGGTTQVTPSTDVSVDEKKGSLIPIPELPTVEKVAASLNALGVSTRDMIAIFMNMKRAGALQAELRVN
ncbi:MAG: flagellar basal body P-ring protein FlgI [Verrucomicrobia bacterium]|nr:flagellar basal body P-ring protein FlgI [Verrucomicrobiota bacterium]